MHRGGHGAGRIGPGVAEVHRDCVPLVFHRHSNISTKMFGELGCGALEYRNSLRGSLIAVICPVRAENLEAVTARVPQARNADPIDDVGEIAAGQHRHRVERREGAQGLGGPVHQGGGPGLVDDRRQGAIEVEEERGPARCHHCVDVSGACQCVWQAGHPAVDGVDRDLRRVTHYRVGPTRRKRGGQAPRRRGHGGDADDEAEPGRARGGDTGFGSGDDDGAARARAEAARGLDQYRRLAIRCDRRDG